MHRRNFIAALGGTSIVGAGAAVARATMAKSRDLAEHSLDTMGRQVQALKKRLDNLEARDRKMTRMVLLLAAVSTGVDVSLLL